MFITCNVSDLDLKNVSSWLQIKNKNFFICNQLLTFFKSKSDTLHVQPDIVVGVKIKHITSELSTQHLSFLIAQKKFLTGPCGCMNLTFIPSLLTSSAIPTHQNSS